MKTARIEANQTCTAEFTFTRDENGVHALSYESNCGLYLSRGDRPEWFKLADKLIAEWLDAN